MKKYLFIALSTLLISGCTTPDIFNEKGSNQASSYKPIKDSDMIAHTHKAADNLMTQASYLKNDRHPILITSIANIVDLNSTSAFGLTVSEQLGDRFAQMGFPVVDLRLRNDVKVQVRSGEYMLSRDVQKISKQHAAGAVLLGTYSVGKNHVTVSTRLVRASDSRILSGYDFQLPMGPNTKTLVRSKTPR